MEKNIVTYWIYEWEEDIQWATVEAYIRLCGAPGIMKAAEKAIVIYDGLLFLEEACEIYRKYKDGLLPKGGHAVNISVAESLRKVDR